MQKATYLEHCHVQDYINELNSMSVRLNEIDIEDDIESFVDNYVCFVYLWKELISNFNFKVNLLY